MPNSNSLHVIILDVSPYTWALRDGQKQQNAKKRAEGDAKASHGPASLEEVLQAIQAFCGAATSMEREAGILIMGVADGEVAVVYPRKDGKDICQRKSDYQNCFSPLAKQTELGVLSLSLQSWHNGWNTPSRINPTVKTWRHN